MIGDAGVEAYASEGAKDADTSTVPLSTAAVVFDRARTDRRIRKSDLNGCIARSFRSSYKGQKEAEKASTMGVRLGGTLTGPRRNTRTTSDLGGGVTSFGTG
jgi:hypothetical protein